jgi:hypothetical protein
VQLLPLAQVPQVPVASRQLWVLVLRLSTQAFVQSGILVGALKEHSNSSRQLASQPARSSGDEPPHAPTPITAASKRGVLFMDETIDALRRSLYSGHRTNHPS